MSRLPAIPNPRVTNWRPIETGYWLVYARRDSLLVPARIFWCDWEPDNEENKLDQPFLAGQIAGKWADPRKLWDRVLRRETRPNDWECARPLVPKEGLTEAQEYAYQISLLEHVKAHEPTNPLAKPYKPIVLSRLPLPF